MKKLQRRSFSRLLRGTRFLGVGGVATLAYWLVLLFLVNICHLDPTISSVAAYLFGIAVSFAGHRSFTYNSKATIRGELSRFLVTYALCFCAGNLVFWIAFAILHWNSIVAGLLLTGCNIALSYAAAELWIFRSLPTAGAPKSAP
jgi:putative flippase GtrA